MRRETEKKNQVEELNPGNILQSFGNGGNKVEHGIERSEIIRESEGQTRERVKVSIGKRVKRRGD